MILGETFINVFHLTKTLHIGGRLGGGKTALAVWLAKDLMRAGLSDNIVSNFPIWGATFPRSAMRCAIVIDEGGLFLEMKSDFKKIAAALRKMSNYVIVPSFIPPAREFSFLKCQRIFNTAGLGLPMCWVYKWRLRMGDVDESGVFVWENPKSVFGLYDTTYLPASDGGIGAWVEKTTRAYSKDDYRFPDDDQDDDAVASDLPGEDKSAQLIDSAADGMSSAADKIATALEKLRKRKRFS